MLWFPGQEKETHPQIIRGLGNLIPTGVYNGEEDHNLTNNGVSVGILLEVQNLNKHGNEGIT